MSWPLRIATLSKGGAARYASRPAPLGYVWAFVTVRGARVTARQQPVVALKRIA